MSFWFSFQRNQNWNGTIQPGAAINVTLVATVTHRRTKGNPTACGGLIDGYVPKMCQISDSKMKKYKKNKQHNVRRKIQPENLLSVHERGPEH